MALYHAYGLTLNSELALLDLPQAEPATHESDVNLVLAQVARTLPGAGSQRENWQAAGLRFQIELPGVARYLVENGTQVSIELLGPDTESHAADYFLTSVMGALLQQRGFLTLHASGIATSRGAVLFCGLSGSGKSTLLARFRAAGYGMITDDVAPLKVCSRHGQKQVFVTPGYPRHRLTEISVKRLGLSTQDAALRNAAIPKYVLPVPKMETQALPVYAICHLSLTLENEVKAEPVPQTEAVALIMRNTFRRRFIKGMGLMPMHFELATRLAGQARVRAYSRPATFDSFDRLPNRIADDLGLQL